MKCPLVLFYGTSGRNFMLLGVLPDSNNLHRIGISKKQGDDMQPDLGGECISSPGMMERRY